MVYNLLMVVLKPDEIQYEDLDSLAVRVFLKALEILGGPRKLIEYRNLTWLPSLMSSSYAVVLHEEFHRTEDEIAEFLGLTRNTVRNMLRADVELVLKKLKGEIENPETAPKEHTAGGLAKFAYREIKEGRDNIELISFFARQMSDIYGIAWPIEVLRKIKGVDFPVKKSELYERLKGLLIEDKRFEDLYDKLPETISSPAQLLHEIKRAYSS